jgi:hypothetical protein
MGSRDWSHKVLAEEAPHPSFSPLPETAVQQLWMMKKNQVVATPKKVEKPSATVLVGC